MTLLSGHTWGRRLVPVAGMPLTYISNSWRFNASPLGVCTTFTIHTILVFRLYGLYGSKKLAYGLTAVLFLAVGGEIYTSVAFSPNFEDIGLGPTIGYVCYPIDARQASWIWCGIVQNLRIILTGIIQGTCPGFRYNFILVRVLQGFGELQKRRIEKLSPNANPHTRLFCVLSHVSMNRV